MKLKEKFRISGGSLIAISVLLILFFITTISSFNKLTKNSATHNNNIENLLLLANYVDDFASHNISLNKILEQYKKIEDEKTKIILSDIQTVDSLQKENDSIEKSIDILTKTSIEKSNTYISEVSKALADPVKRNSVSSLQRLIIITANLNTCVNYEIGNLFQKLKQDDKYSDSLIDYLDTAIVNAVIDEKRLAGTKYAMLPTAAKESNIKIKDLILKYIENQAKIEANIAEARNKINNYIAELSEQVNVEQRKALTTMIVLLAIIILLSLGVVAFIINLSNYISAFIFKLNKDLQTITKGDLTITVKNEKFNKDDEVSEINNSLEKLILYFKKIISQISTGAKQLAEASAQLNNASVELSHRTNEQAATAEEISSSMEEMLATVEANTERSEDTNKITTIAADKIKENKDSILQSLSAVANISEKITIISEIADKTDILSINAAIEAARAGEAGRGFAVVAQEVRKLADKTQIAAKEIDELSNSNIELSKKSSEQLQEIIAEIIKSAELINNVVVASQEQKINIESINSAILQLTETTNQNSASAEELSASAEELLAQAEQLKQIISTFRLN